MSFRLPQRKELRVHLPGPRLPDGTYRVVTPSFVAGFVVRDGWVVECAPILRRRLAHWASRAQRIGA